MGIAQRNQGFKKSGNRLAGPLKPKSDSRSGPEWERIKAIVKERDDYTCVRCGAEDNPNNPSVVQLTVDHIVPVAKGGLNILSNLETLCADCHSKKRGKANEAGKHLLKALQTKKTKRFFGG